MQLVSISGRMGLKEHCGKLTFHNKLLDKVMILFYLPPKEESLVPCHYRNASNLDAITHSLQNCYSKIKSQKIFIM
jgi:hypothetical protein